MYGSFGACQQYLSKICTGAEPVRYDRKDAAERILHANGIYDVTVHHIPGNLTDHYNPANKTLGLSDATYNSASVAAIGVAAP